MNVRGHEVYQGGGEMAFRTICVALLLSSLPIAGCGTAVNIVRPGPAGGKVPFGGVKHDVCCIKQSANGECAFQSGWQQYRQRARGLFCAVDLPFSAIGDVVTWPYTATFVYINQTTPLPPVPLPPSWTSGQTLLQGTPSRASTDQGGSGGRGGAGDQAPDPSKLPDLRKLPGADKLLPLLPDSRKSVSPDMPGDWSE